MEALQADHSLRSTQTEASLEWGTRRRADPRDHIHCRSKPQASPEHPLTHLWGLSFFILAF